jgi:hypothetical protein
MFTSEEKNRMESAEEKIKRLEFQQSLLLNMIDHTKFPFYRLVLNAGLLEEEMKEVIELCEELDNKYKKLKEEGFVHFTFLLTHFVGMLNPKLHPLEVAEAMYKQAMFAPLMQEFIKLLKQQK